MLFRGCTKYMRLLIFAKIACIAYFILIPTLRKFQNHGPAAAKKSKISFFDSVDISKLRSLAGTFKNLNLYNDSFEMHNFDDEAFIYSAFIDLRKGNMGYPKLRILALLKAEISFSCNFSTGSGHSYQKPVSFYEMAESHRMLYKTYLLSCTIPDESLVYPKVMTSFILERTQTGTTRNIRISNVIWDDKKIPVKYKHGYTVCIPTLFGNRYTPRYLIEFIEINKLLGADHLVFYLNSDAKIRYGGVLNFYNKIGLVTYYDSIIPASVTSRIWNYAQSLVANDCLYRYVGRSQYIIFNDLDEYFVPYTSQQWGDLFESHDLWTQNNDTMAGYVLQTYYFSVNNWSVVDRFVLENSSVSGVRSDKSLTKCIVRPERIFEQGIHHVSRVVQDYYKVEKLDSQYGALHHYKISPPRMANGNNVERNRLIDLTNNDQFQDKLADRLWQNLKNM